MITDIRKQIRNKAEMLRLDENTIISAITAEQKLHLHVTKLLMNITNAKC